MDAIKDLDTTSSSNRFRFRKLKDRVAHTEVSTARRLRAQHEFAGEVRGNDEADAELKNSFFRDAVMHEREAAKSGDFHEFLTEIHLLVQNLPLILHNLDAILETFFKHLRRPTGVKGTKGAILRLLAVLIKDVQDDAFSHLQAVFEVVFGLVDAADLPLCTEVFRCVGEILGELGPCITQRDADLVLLRPFFQTMLGHRRNFVRRFAAEAFAPLVRQLRPKQMSRQISRIVARFASGKEAQGRHAQQQKEVVDGAALMVFYMLRNVQHHLHSRAPEILRAVMVTLRTKHTSSASLFQLEQRVAVVSALVRLSFDFTRRETCAPVWDALVDSLRAEGAHEPRAVGFLCDLVRGAVQHRDGARVQEAVRNDILGALTDNVLPNRPWTSTDPDEVPVTGALNQVACLLWALWVSEIAASDAVSPLAIEIAQDLVLRGVEADQAGPVVETAMDMVDLVQLFPSVLEPFVQRVDKAASVPLPSLGVVAKIADRVHRHGRALGDAPNDAAGTIALRANNLDVASGVIAKTCIQSLLGVTKEGLIASAEARAAAMTHIRCLQLYNQGFEAALTHVIHVSIAAPELFKIRNKAVMVLTSCSDWSIKAGKKARRSLTKAFVHHIDSMLQTAGSIDAFAALLADASTLSESAKAEVRARQQVLTENLMSPSHVTRLASLRILKAVLPPMALMRKPEDDPAAPDEPCDALDRMIVAESLPITSTGERTRASHFNYLERLTRLERLPHELLGVVSAFCLGQLHVKFTPVWKLVRQNLETLAAKHFRDALWPMLWFHIRAVAAADVLPHGAASVAEPRRRVEVPLMTDVWASAKASKHQGAELDEDEDAKHFKGLPVEIALMHQSAQPLDVFNETMAAITPFAKKVEQFSQDVVPLFFSFLRDEFYACSGRFDMDQPAQDEAENSFLKLVPPCAVAKRTTLGGSLAKLESWLRLFAGFSKFRRHTPHDHRDVLQAVFQRFLFKAEANLQLLALKCLQRMRLPALEGHNEMLEELAEEQTFRNALVRHKLADVPDEQRAGLVPIVLGIVLGRMALKKSNAGKRRAAALTFLRGLRSNSGGSSEIEQLLQLVFRVFPRARFDFTVRGKEDVMPAIRNLDIPSQKLERLQGFVGLLGDLIKQFESMIRPFVDKLLLPIVGMLWYLQQPNYDGAFAGAGRSQISQLRNELTLRFSQIIREFPDHNMSIWTVVMREVLQAPTARLASSVLNATHPPSLLQIIAAFAESPDMSKWAFTEIDVDLVGETIRCLGEGIDSGRAPGPAVVSVVFDVIDSLIDSDTLAETVLLPHVPHLLDMLLKRFDTRDGNGNPAVHFNSQIKVSARALSNRALTILCKVAKLTTRHANTAKLSAETRTTCGKLIDLLSQFLRFAGAHAFSRRTLLTGPTGMPKVKRADKEDGNDDQDQDDDDDDEEDEEEGGEDVEEEQLHRHLGTFITSGRIRPRSDFEGRQDSRGDLLATIKGLLSLADVTQAHVETFSQLLGVCWLDPIYDNANRRELISLFEILADTKGAASFDLKQVARLLGDLNSWEKRRVGMHDFERRLVAYNKLCSNAGEYTWLQLLPVTYQAMFDLNDDEYPLRSSASHFLTSVVLCRAHNDERIHRLVVPVVMPALRGIIKSRPALVRKSAMHVLGEASLLAAGRTQAASQSPPGWPREVMVAMHADLAQLAEPDDLEKDFFQSVVHVQAYRQAEALFKLSEALSEGSVKLTIESLMQVVVQTALHLLAESTTEKFSNLQHQVAPALATFAALLPWTQYSNLLLHILECAGKNMEMQKRYLNVACQVVDSYHFAQDARSDVIEQQMQRRVIPKLERFLKGRRSPGSTAQCVRVSVAVAVVKALKHMSPLALKRNLARLLRRICDVLRSVELEARNDARETLVAVSLELGPQYFAKVVETVCDVLKAGYMLHIRGYSLNALLKGTESMHVQHLKEERLERKQLVPGAKEEREMSPEMLLQVETCGGALDGLLDKFVEVIEEELFGELANQKRADSGYHSRVKRLLESRSNKSFEMLQSLSGMVAFLPTPSIHQILEPVLSKIATSSDTKVLRVTEEALRRVQLGLSQNPDVRVPHLLVYIHHLVSSEYKGAKTKRKRVKLVEEAEDPVADNLADRSVNLTNWLVRESEAEQAKAQVQVRVRNAYEGIHIVEEEPQMTGKDRFENKRKRGSKEFKSATRKANRHIIVEHALELLVSALKHKRLDQTVPSHREMLDPFVPLLASVMRESRASRTFVLALRALCVLLSWDLASMREYAPGISRSIFKMLRKVGFSAGSASAGASASSIGVSAAGTANDTNQECLRALTVLLRKCDYHEVSDEDLKILVLLAQHNMDIVPRQQTTLGLVRSIVERRLVVAEIYDLMKLLTEQVFTATSPQVRHMSTQILVAFLIHYPLAEKRLRQHLDLIVANLDFEMEDGRLGGLNMLRVIVNRFPVELVEDISQFCFLPLVLRLVNDDSPECRKQVAHVIQKIVNKLGPAKAQALLGIVEVWLETASAAFKAGSDGAAAAAPQELLLERAAVQIIGLVAESDVGPELKSDRASLYLERTCDILRREIVPSREHNDWEERFAGLEEAHRGAGWRTTFHAMATLRKLAVSCKVLGKCGDSLTAHRDGTSVLQDLVLPHIEFHPHLGVRLMGLRLLGQVLGDVEVASVVQVAPSQKASKPATRFLADTQDAFELAKIHANLLNNPRIDEDMGDQLVKNLVWIASVFAANEPDDIGGAQEKADADSHSSPLGWLVRRLSFTARYKGGGVDDRVVADRRQGCVFKLFAFIATQLADHPKRLVPYLVPMFAPLVRVSQGSLPNSVLLREPLRAPELARETLELVEKIVGSPAFVRAFTTVQSQIDSVRSSRRHDKNLERVKDPAVAIKKRMAKNLATRRNKKRRIEARRKFQGR
ncbi:Small subunit processome component 20 homolog (Down-regulated in metastasis protein) [Durusdinium trenchii]|uniref:Small subunit processome component 20 homolog (Down-regulated in metastasis protein) n=1 Tax=Durusdinium trenchii TaxID=1381693 RepID=A0ABP0HLC0_9DINO